MPQKDHDGLGKPTHTAAQEEEAHCFAMALLMPETLLRACVPHTLRLSNALDTVEVKHLATRFEVERELMTARLLDLGLLV